MADLRVLVTGGAQGIGLAAAVRFREDGARVAVLDRQPAAADLVAVEADITDAGAVDRAVRTAVEILGGLDVLVNNAAIGAAGGVEDNPDDEWLQVLNVNVVGIARVTRAALPALRRSPSAAIVNTCSVAAACGLPQRVLYSAGKGAVCAMTRALAADLIKDGIRVNSVSPGTADTPWVGRLLDAAEDPGAARAALEGRQPHGRLVTADEIAGAITYLADPRSGSTTGTCLTVDGGLTAVRLPS